MKTWRADFLDNWDDRSRSRSMMIFADNEDEAVAQAAAQMGNAARFQFVRVLSKSN
jgi:hypothetical protein